jgi:amidase
VNLHTRTASELAHLIRSRSTTSTDVVAAHLQRIAEVNPKINAVVQLDPDAALAAARSADDAVAHGNPLGPLHGVPFTVKDWIEAEGLICAAGFEERRAYVPKRDATVVARLRAAGGVLLAKTNVNDGGPVYPRPNNPHDVTRWTGGSSSGEAAIVAAGGSPLGIGSDSGGSIRWPAHCCGVASLKPTTGRVPNTGHVPRTGHLQDPRTVIGPIARSVADLTLALTIIAGPGGRDPGAIPVPLEDPGIADLSALRIAWYTDMPGASPTIETIATTEAAARALDADGARIMEAHPPRLEEALAITQDYWSRPASMSASRWLPYKTASLSSDDVERHLFEWERFRVHMLVFMEDYDAIICPVSAEPAPLHGLVPVETWLYTLPYSLAGWPVVTVPCGVSPEGLPIGLQVIAGPWREHLALAVAAYLERALGAYRAPNI